MKKIILALLLVCNCASVLAYGFNSKITANIVEMDKTFYDQDIMSGKILLEVVEVADVKKGEESYPVGTKILLNSYASRGARYYDNPKLYSSIARITLPDGQTVSNNYDKFEIKPISGIKSTWIPFYRIVKIFGDEINRSIKQGSFLTIKPTSGNDVIAVLKSNTQL